MPFQETTATKKIKALQKRIRIIQGGTGASKTISILLYLMAMAQSDDKPTITSIVSESFPHLRRGAMRDFLQILKDHNYYKDGAWDITNSTYTFETGSKIEFFSVDQPDKMRGARRDRLFINEANNIKFEAYEELEVRTNEFVIIDFNPTSEFWVFTELLGKRNDIDHIILTYKDNEALPEEVVKTIEQRMERKDWWQVYGLGQLGHLEGLIYKGWQITEEIPHEARLEGYGLDYGYTNDPTAIVAVYYYNGGYILDEVLFQKGLSNRQIADILKNQTPGVIVPDSAEPKSNDELKEYGLNIVPAEKGRDSVANGIQVVQDQRIWITKRSLNGIKEYRNYQWQIDKNGKVINIPEHTFSHFMDAVRYIITFLKRKPIIDVQQFQRNIHLRQENSTR